MTYIMVSDHSDNSDMALQQFLDWTRDNQWHEMQYIRVQRINF